MADMNQTRPQAQAPQWHESHNCYSLDLVAGLSVHVNWDCRPGASGYRVSCGTLKLKRNVADLEEAKAAGIALARYVLTEAGRKLDMHRMQHGPDYKVERRECSGPLPGRDVTVVQTGGKTLFVKPAKPLDCTGPALDQGRGKVSL